MFCKGIKIPIAGRLYGTGDDKSTDAGLNRVGTGNRILGIGGCRNGNLSGNCGEHTGEIVIGVIGGRCPYSTVKGYGNRIQNRIEGIGYNNVVVYSSSRVAGVLDNKGVGELSIFRNGGRRQGFADA